VGFFHLEVDVPSNDNSLPFQAYEVATITTNATVQPEVVVYSMVGGSSGSINMKIVRKNAATQAIIYNVNTTVAYGCSAASFQAALNMFNSFSGYDTRVVRNVYDSKLNIINTLDTPPSSASQIDYVVSIYLQRTQAYQA
jgi:hypothetical protein